MKNFDYSLFVEINNLSYIFFVGYVDEHNNFKLVYKSEVPLEGMKDNSVSDLDSAFNVIKENIFLMEQKLNFTFKETILILENFKPTFINFSGYKKLNGSQVLRENITYILNTLKSCVDKFELKKKVLHIFNSKFILDNKKIDNLPIGLFGDFYSHELSFVLISSNDYKNLEIIFERCNLKIKKTYIKSFIKGAYLSETFNNKETFFQIKIENNNSKIFYFENNSLKYEQDFEFGSDIIVKDISKITSLKIDNVKDILSNIELKKDDLSEDEILEEKFFKNCIFRKIKKKLIYEIALARANEVLELLILNNINLKHYKQFSKKIFFDFNDQLHLKSLKEIFKDAFMDENHYEMEFLENVSNENILNTANRLVHYGWKKEAIPVTQFEKSLIARFFDAIFG